MIKKMGAGMVMAIMLVSAFGWVAIVGLVIKPDFPTGIFLSLAGGAVIGLIIAYLMVMVIMKHVGVVPLIDVKRVTKHKEYELGTRLQTGLPPYRYCRAGEDLKENTWVEPNLSGRLVIGGPLPGAKDINELVYGNVMASRSGAYSLRGVLGWPLVAVRKYRYFWLCEMPPGAELKKECKGNNEETNSSPAEG